MTRPEISMRRNYATLGYPMPKMQLQHPPASFGDAASWLEEGLGQRIPAPALGQGWGAVAATPDRDLRVQAARGYAATIVPLKPGLYVVAITPENVARNALAMHQSQTGDEVGIFPLLMPILTSVYKAIEQPIAKAIAKAKAKKAAERAAENQPAATPAAPALGCDCHANVGCQGRACSCGCRGGR